MTKQKFYELCILKTYQRGTGPEELENEIDVLTQMGCDFDHMTFAELQLKRAIAGFNPNFIPNKHPFDRLGFDYIVQLLGFVKSEDNMEFTEQFFDLLSRYPDLVDCKSEDQGGFLFQIYVDSIVGENSKHSFARSLGDYLLRNGQGADWYQDMLKIAHAFGITHDVSLSELIGLRNKWLKD